ncbi:MAG: PIG-L deacetylase family protein, partial [Planctomycetota bacterium]
DDIEFFMAGTMLQLAACGWTLHYVNLCDGSRGSSTMDQSECARVRLGEAQEACRILGATFHPPIFPDMEASYTFENVAKVTAILRAAKPSIVLTHSPSDYMEDHEVACRLAVSAAFAHGMPNLVSDPPVEPYYDPVTVYHAQPVGNRTPLGELVYPHFYTDISSVIDRKEQSLAAHASQKQWLDESQGQDSYLQTMRDLGKEVGKMSGEFEYAEGWRKHLHIGFCGPEDDPLRQALADITVEGESP